MPALTPMLAFSLATPQLSLAGSITVNERENVPEPMTLGLLAIGLAGFSLRRRQTSDR